MQDMQDAMNHMGAAPNGVFGGHKGEAMHHTQIAIAELKKALEYREHADYQQKQRGHDER